MHRRFQLLLALVLIVIIVMVFVSRRCSSDTELSGRIPLTVQLQWEPSAQFIGFYVAKQRGYYLDEKLDVRFLHGGPNVNPIDNIVDENAGIGLSTADQVLRWNSIESNDKLLAFGTVFSRSLAVFMVHADSNINEPTDFVGKKIGVFPSYDTESLLLLLLKKAGIDRKQIQQINFPNFANFEFRNVDVYGAYIINEPVLAGLRNIKTRLIDPQKEGIYFYSDTLIARRDYFQKNREIISAFLRASIRGWSDAEENLSRALEDMRKEVGGVFGPGEPWKHQEGVAEATIKYLRGERSQLFVMSRDRWQKMEQALQSIGVLPKSGIVEETCDFSFVERTISTMKNKY